MDGISQTLPTLYRLTSADFHDITSGSNGNSAHTGYDMASGIGSPVANVLVPDLSGVTVPPMVAGASPSLGNGTLPAGTTSLTISFNRPMLGAGNAANYQFQSVGADGLLGTADDAIVSLAASYSGTTATLTFAALSENVYRLTISDTITDAAGNKLDGDGDGVCGGNWVSDFVVVPNSPLFSSVATFGSGGSTPYGLATGDFNGDGIPDLAVANNSSSGTVSILLGNGQGGFSTAKTFSTGGSTPRSVAAGDFNNDGKLDLAVTNYGGTTVAILLGNGSGGFGAATTFNSGGDVPQGLALGDFNGDGWLDIATTHWDSSSGSVGILLNNGSGGFTTSTVSQSGGGANDIAAADFNHDGNLDLVALNGGSTPVGILLGNGNGGFTAAAAYGSGGSWPQGIAVGDFNGDGFADVAVSNYSSGTVGVLLNDGTGHFGGTTTFSSGGTDPGRMVVADFNGDGKLDIAVHNQGSNNVGVLLGNGSGGFANALTFSSGGSTPLGIVTADLNGDGKPDLAVTNKASNTVGVLLNGFVPPAVTLNSPHGLPFDIAVGNFGAGETHPGKQ